MIDKKKRTILLFFLILFPSILLSGCLTANSNEPTLENTVDLDAFRTEVASTVVAQLTEEAPKVQKPSDTPVSTNTPKITASPTVTFAPTNTVQIPTATLKVVYPTYTSIPYTDSAIIISKSPADGVSFGPNTDFDIKWTVQNTGRRAWNQDFYYRYASGVQGKTGSMYYVGGNLSVGDQKDLIVDMVAPGQPGTYNTYWQLINDDGVVILTLSLVFYVN